MKSCDAGRSFWWREFGQRPRLITYIAAAMSLAVGAGLTFRRTTTPWSVLPDYDYWANITGLITESGIVLDLEDLFHHNNEHIVVVPKLIYLANYLVTSGSNIGLILYSISAGAACAILLLLHAGDLLRATPARWALCGVLFPLAMFSAKLSHSYYFGMSGTIWLTADLFVILSAAALAKAAKLHSTAWLLASLLAALLGVLTYSTAIYSLLVLLVFSVVLLFVPKFCASIPRAALVGVASVVVAVVIAWLVQRTHPKGHPALDFDPIGVAGFVLVYVGAPVANGYWHPIVGATILAAGALALYRLFAMGHGQDIFLWVALFFYAPFNGLVTGIGRLGFGIQAAASSRYQNVATISLMATIVLVLAALPKQDASPRSVWIRAATFIALFAMAVFFVAHVKTTKFYAKRLATKPVAEIALRQGIAGDKHLAAGTPSIRKIYQLISALRSARHVPFNTMSVCERFVGKRLPRATTGGSAGAIESMATYTVSQEETRTAIELSGWTSQAGTLTECIAVVDGTGVVIGAGVTAMAYPDAGPKGSLRIGWRAVARYPKNDPVCAYALIPETSVWSPLANCLALTSDNKHGYPEDTSYIP